MVASALLLLHDDATPRAVGHCLFVLNAFKVLPHSQIKDNLAILLQMEGEPTFHADFVVAIRALAVEQIFPVEKSICLL